MPCRCRLLLALVAAVLWLRAAPQLTAQRPYPVAPRGLPEGEEIALAMSAAPAEISARADIYVLRGTDYVKARAGTNGCACMVSRDLHPGSVYPMCFDQEAAKTSLRKEILESSLRAKGKSESEIMRAVDAALASGELRTGTKPAVSYMMSPRQVLFSSPYADGVRVGAWSPHLMVFVPGMTPDQLGLAAHSAIDAFSLSQERANHPELIVKVPIWSDGTLATTPTSRK